MASAADSDLDVLDYLELFSSTVVASSLLEISQSTCSRRYRAVSARFDLGFDRVGHQYQATRNHDVLQHLRQAAQRLRVRNHRIRSVRGWQLGITPVQSLGAIGLELDRRDMNSWSILSLLEQRLIDLAVIGISEFQAHLPEPLSSLKSGKLMIGANLQCIPLCEWRLRLVARHDHPLWLCQASDPQELANYPSPALPMGVAPLMMAAMQSCGLATQLCNLTSYDERQWEGFACETGALAYAHPFLLPGLKKRYGLMPLPIALPFQECLAVVGHRDVFADPAFAAHCNLVYQDIQTVLSPYAAELKWLG